MILHLNTSQYIGMSFRLEMCGQMVIKRRKVVKLDGVELPPGHIADIQTSCKYLSMTWEPLGGDKEYSNIQYQQRIRQGITS